MIPIIDDFVQRFNLTDFIVVADSGLMSETNVNLLESAGISRIQVYTWCQYTERIPEGKEMVVGCRPGGWSLRGIRQKG